MVGMKSMTGFGRGEASINGATICVELSSLNRKQIDVALSLPRPLADLEQKIRSKVHSAVSRGRVNVAVSIECSRPFAARAAADFLGVEP